MEENKNYFRGIILNFPEQLKKDLFFFNQLQLQRRSFKKILICGIGGSGLMGDFFQFLKDYSPFSLPINLQTHKSYSLPADIDQETLAIIISYSGNTTETISSFKETRKRGLEIAGVTSGGELGRLFEENKIPWIKIPDTAIPPRMSLGYQFNGLIKIMMAYGLLIPDARHEINCLSEKINPAAAENQIKFICPKIGHKIPIIYASGKNETVVKIWKIQLNENAKTPAFYNIFPELNHNEMAGWTKTRENFIFLFLQDTDDIPEIKYQMKITAQLLKEMRLPIEFIEIAGETPLEKLFNAIITGNWLSYHLALFRGLDPASIAIVEEFKKRLKS